MSARFFVDRPFDGCLTGEDAHHAARVLRVRVGESVVVCDGQGNEAQAHVESVAPQAVALTVGEWTISRAEPRVQITLYAAVSKGERMDFTVQKAVEIGAVAIVPFLSERCVAKGEGHKPERWRKIAKQAASQAGRGILPTVGEVIGFAQALEQAARADSALFCYEVPTGKTLRQALPSEPPQTVAVLCGPEGGFSENEAAQAAEMTIPITMGKRIFRCETAPLVALSAILYHYHEI